MLLRLRRFRGIEPYTPPSGSDVTYGGATITVGGVAVTY